MMTRLIASVFADTNAELRARTADAFARGADVVEWRIDTWEDSPVEFRRLLLEHGAREVIVTCRSQDEGGHFRTDTMERVARLIELLRGTHAKVDFEFADFQRSSNIAQKVRLAADSDRASQSRLILSSHDFNGSPPNHLELADAMLRVRETAAVKIAFRCGDINDSWPALDMLRRYGSRMVAIGMGEAGLWSRILAKKLGAFGSYGTLLSGTETAPGQVTIDDMISRFRWRNIDASTRVFGVVGNPVTQSMSPALFNHWFDEANYNGVYLPLHVHDGNETLFRFLEECGTRPWLDLTGFSVTRPHKIAAFKWLGDRADRSSLWIGAVNTLLIRNGDVSGYNTDAYAAVDSLVSALGCTRADLADVTVDILGCGGAARAVLSALRDFGTPMTLYARDPSKSRDLAEAFGASMSSWDQRRNRSGDVVINCTSVGMYPFVEESPLPTDALNRCRLVFDLIYNPLETRLLKHAAAASVQTLNGVDMFVRQAATQLELWTGMRPSLDAARNFVVREINRRCEESSRRLR